MKNSRVRPNPFGQSVICSHDGSEFGDVGQHNCHICSLSPTSRLYRIGNPQIVLNCSKSPCAIARRVLIASFTCGYVKQTGTPAGGGGWLELKNGKKSIVLRMRLR